MTTLVNNYTPPVIITLAQTQAWLNLAGDEILDQVTGAVDGANQAVVDYLGWNPCQITETVVVDGNPSGQLLLPGKKIVSINSVNLLRTCDPAAPQPISLVGSWFDQNEGMAWIAYAFPSDTNNVQVNWTRGYSPLPATIITATRYTVLAHLAAAEVDHNTVQQMIVGVAQKQWATSGPGTIPVSAATLLRPFRLKM